MARESAGSSATAVEARPRRSAERRPEIHDSAVVDEAWIGRIATADGAFVTDERQRVVAWSSSAQRMLGFSPEELVGQPCFLALMGREPDGHPVCRRGCAVIRNARRGRGTASYEVTARTRDGSARSLSFSIVVVERPRGGFHVLHLFRDAGASAPARSGATRRDVAEAPRTPPAQVDPLTRRELQVLGLLAQGSTIDEIAEHLSISIFTARNHVANVQCKLGARNRLETVLLAMRRGLV